VGDGASGFHQMMEMVNSSRLSNAMRAAAIMRRALLESVVHARGRAAFGGALFDKPLLRLNLLEMLLDSEAAAAVVLQGAAIFDAWDAGDAHARKLLRIITPVAKGWITARARIVAGEAMNVRGGNGYVEEWVNARLLRDSYLGAIWEGSTNVVALDVQRAIVKDGCLEPLAAYVTGRLDTVTDPRAKPVADAVRGTLADVHARVAAWPRGRSADTEVEARPVAEALYHALAGSLLLEHGQLLVTERGDYRTFLVASLYVRKYLRPPAPPAPLVPPRTLDQLAALIDWTPVPADALSGDLPGHP